MVTDLISHQMCLYPSFYPSVFRHSEPVKYFLQSKNNFIHSAVFFFCPDAVKKFHHDRKIFMAFFLTLIGANKDEDASAFKKKKKMKTPVASWLLSFCCLTFCLSSLINLNGHFNAFFGVSVDLLDISLCVSEQLPLLSWTEKPVTPHTPTLFFLQRLSREMQLKKKKDKAPNKEHSTNLPR